MPNKRAADKVQISLRIRDVDVAEIERVAAAAGVRKTVLIERAVREFMARQGEKGGAAA